jgi:hypothetical protein
MSSQNPTSAAQSREVTLAPDTPITLPLGDYAVLMEPVAKQFPRELTQSFADLFAAIEAKQPLDGFQPLAVMQQDPTIAKKYHPQNVYFQLAVKYYAQTGQLADAELARLQAAEAEATAPAPTIPEPGLAVTKPIPAVTEPAEVPANRAQRRKADKPAASNKKTATSLNPAAVNKETPIVTLVGE